MKLLEEYENETKLKKNTKNKESPSKEIQSEKIDSSTTKTEPGANVESSSSQSSTDDDWEKIEK